MSSRADPEVSKASLARMIEDDTPEERGLLLAVILFAHANGLTIDDLAEVVVTVHASGERKFVDDANTARESVESTLADLKAELRRCRMRSIPGGKDPE